MANGIVIKSNEGGYETKAYRFVIADDLYLFFRFESPKSNCEIAIAYDVFVDSRDWYVNDGLFDYDECKIIDDVIFDKLPMTTEWLDFRAAIDAAVRKFNGV